MCRRGAEIVFDGLPDLNVLIQLMPAGKFSDVVPDVNLVPAGICSILSSGGVPIPCTPAPVDPWITGFPSVLINGSLALYNFSMCACALVRLCGWWRHFNYFSKQ